MREILFRGKRVNNGEWIQGSLVMTDDNYNEPFSRKKIKQKYQICNYVAGDWSLGGWSFDDVIPESIGQFTGLTDKNGKKIFEGDICSGYKCQYVISFKNGCFMWGNDLLGFEIQSEYDVNGGWLVESTIDQTCIEVIGNIYDNPKLLK